MPSGSKLFFESICLLEALLTVGVPVGSDVLWRAGEVEDDELGLVRLVDDDLVEAHRRVHPPHVRRLVPEKGRETDAIMSKCMIGIAHFTRQVSSPGAT